MFMPQRLSQDEFIRRVKLLHNNKYDYSRVVYSQQNEYVDVICPVHGVFKVTPKNHMKGRGCPLCAKNHKLTQEDFLRKAKAVHGDKYDYSKTVYVKNAGIVEIICPKHGVFRQEANSHLQGHGCPNCANEVKHDAMVRHMQNGGIEQRRNMCLEKYGATNVMKVNSFKKKCVDVHEANSTLNTSSVEDDLYNRLIDYFGKNDVVRQYRSDLYPYLCDFYVKSRNLYIEVNCSWTHGFRWYESDDTYCVEKLALWQSKVDDSDYYFKAVETWSVCDVKKRNFGTEYQLNYVVFWFPIDIDVWFSMGCPDGRDWDYEYSWLPSRDYLVIPKKDIKYVSSNLSYQAKYYQQDVFYKREKDLWYTNPWYKNTFLRMYLYGNRLEYLHKSPCDLTDFQLLRAFYIAGIVRSYSAFDVSLMRDVIRKYDIASVYDPCAGWGERMLCCAMECISYVGMDINKDLEQGYQNMISDLDLRNQKFVVGDSGSVKLDSVCVDAVITCPPYSDLEHYTDIGAENLSWSEFLGWWQRVVSISVGYGIKYFCFQINQKWRDKMLYVVLNSGFRLVDELFFDHKKSSHFTRRNGVDFKRELESMLVCEKC